MRGGDGLREGVVVNLNKPPDITSHQAARKVQRILGASKAGHAGTLDPFAEGVLLVCLNDATRIAEYLLPLEKEYMARIRLGLVTDTLDITGKVVSEEDPSGITGGMIAEVLGRFRGELMQIPPMYSAIKRDGVPLYRLARRGVTVRREERRVFVREIELISFVPPEFVMRVRCSKGTYVRSLARDIGEALGVGAVVSALRRTAVGDFRVEDSVSFSDLEGGAAPVSSMDDALGHLGEIVLDSGQFRLARHGTEFFSAAAGSPGDLFRLKDPSGVFFAIGRLKDGGVMKVEKVFLHSSPKT
ncbi:MAG TPA: tRNA pseudouridine(55) synthase TruB [Nitrospirae bacterium]|nr:tRNA pseudouridine(55) synthase TruB [Nitrospirota bacterium]